MSQSPPQAAESLRTRATALREAGAVEPIESLPIEIEGSAHRIDGAHPGISSPTAQVTLDAGVVEPRHAEPPNEDELLIQAGQIAQHLRSQIGEMDRREQLLSSQLTLLDDERRQMRLWVQRFETDMRQRATRFKSREDELQARIAQSERLVDELQSQADDLRNAREELGRMRAGLREQLAAELEGQRTELQLARSAVEENRRLLAVQAEDNQREHQATILETRRQLEEEWSRLHARVAQDFETERTQFELDRASWAAQRDAEQQRLTRERETTEARLRSDEEEVDSKKRSLSDELQRLRLDHEHTLRDERAKFEDERDRTRLQLQQERTVFENRVRFQQESLQKSRGEIEAARQEFRVAQQQVRVENERADTLLRLRRAQLDRSRSLIEEREASLQREQELLARGRVSFDSESDRDRNRLRLERETWLQERQAQRAELRRQQDAITAHAENLEARRSRLDHLRAELEETHRSTLEMRMAIEEAWAQLCQQQGNDAARGRVEAARNSFAEYYQHLQDALATHRSELQEAQQAFLRQRDEFHSERQTLALWMQERDESLRLWEGELRVEADKLDLRESAWRVARDRWNQEKIGAEEIIRDLLRQLTHLNGLDGAPARTREPMPPVPNLLDVHLPPMPLDLGSSPR